MISKKNIIIIISVAILLLIGIGGYFIYKNKISAIDNIPNQEVAEENNQREEDKDNVPTFDSSTKEGILSAMDYYGKLEDFDNFSKYLKVMYQNQWDKDPNLEKKESEIYMDVTTKYFDINNINEALRISTIVYNEVSQGWRFRYLRIRCLEKIGRDAYIQNDLVKAEEYAMKILQMMFRLEGSDLLADVYIKKIEDNLAKEDKMAAANNLNFIWDYEVSQDRRDRLTELKNILLK
ncbi:MAG: hypothetical protein WAW15_03225 [Minisyncoccales bacterium]